MSYFFPFCGLAMHFETPRFRNWYKPPLCCKKCWNTKCSVFLTNASEVVTSKRTTSPNNKHHISEYAIKQLKLSFPRKVKIWGHALKKCGMLETASKHRYIWVPTDCLFLIFLFWVPRLKFCNKSSWLFDSPWRQIGCPAQVNAHC